MQYAKSILTNQRIQASPNIPAVCEICNSLVIPKCGNINIHHWAHKSTLDCDNFYEPESEWHRSWKNLFPESQTEVKINRHRADIVKNDGTIIELQHSSISSYDIRSRELEYKKMAWLFDGRDLLQNGLNLRKRDNYYSFRWKHARKHIAECNQDVFLDLGICIFLLKKIYLGPPCGGWGVVILNSEFKEWLLE